MEKSDADYLKDVADVIRMCQKFGTDPEVGAYIIFTTLFGVWEPPSK